MDFDHEGFTLHAVGRPADRRRGLRLRGAALDLTIRGRGTHVGALKLNGRLLPAGSRKIAWGELRGPRARLELVRSTRPPRHPVIVRADGLRVTQVADRARLPVGARGRRDVRRGGGPGGGGRAGGRGWPARQECVRPGDETLSALASPAARRSRWSFARGGADDAARSAGTPQPWSTAGMQPRRDWVFENVRRRFRRLIDRDGNWQARRRPTPSRTGA